MSSFKVQSPPQTAHANDGRTLMAAVLFADLVGYSKKAVTDQMAAKEALREYLQAALEPVGAGSRVVVDTGDGAAMAFLADPEHALYVALRLRRDVRAGAAQTLLQPGDLRLGINLGPVRRIADVNGRPNLVGEGMNSAERVMSFSPPGEISASRSFCDAVSCLHSSYQELFEPMGERADKHGRRHEIFRVAASSAALEAATTSLAPVSMDAAPAKPSRAARELARAGRPAAIAAVVIAFLGMGVAAWALRGGDRPPEPRQVASPPPTPAVQLPAAAPAIAANPAASPATVEPVTVTEKVPAETGLSEAAAEPKALAIRAEEVPPASAPLAPREAAKVSRAPRPAADAPLSPRCTSLLQRAAVGERLAPSEQQELRTSCR